MSRTNIVLSRYKDVLAALRNPRLSAVGTKAVDETAHSQLRESAAAWMTPSRLSEWRAEIEPLALVMFPNGSPVELVSQAAEPWSLECAMRLIRPAGDGKHLAGLARDVIAAAADPFNEQLQESSLDAINGIARSMQGQLASLQTQAFVALSQTLPCFLAGAWLTLLQHPGQMEALRAGTEPIAAAVEELLRYSGPSHAQFRFAIDDAVVNGTAIPKGARVTLMLAAANRDPEQFADSGRFDIKRRESGHLAFGAGVHACLGAVLIRTAAILAMEGFVQRFAHAEVIEYAAWPERWAIRSPQVLRVSFAAYTG